MRPRNLSDHVESDADSDLLLVFVGFDSPKALEELILVCAAYAKAVVEDTDHP